MVKGAKDAVKDKVPKKEITRPRYRKGAWEPSEIYFAQAWDNPQARYKTENVGNVRYVDRIINSTSSRNTRQVFVIHQSRLCIAIDTMFN